MAAGIVWASRPRLAWATEPAKNSEENPMRTEIAIAMIFVAAMVGMLMGPAPIQASPDVSFAPVPTSCQCDCPDIEEIRQVIREELGSMPVKTSETVVRETRPQPVRQIISSQPVRQVMTNQPVRRVVRQGLFRRQVMEVQPNAGATCSVVNGQIICN